jgi:hypothetical protein
VGYDDRERSYGWYGSEVLTIMAVHIIIVAGDRSQCCSSFHPMPSGGSVEM